MNTRFGIDVDGVLANFGSRVVEIANKIWPNKLPEGYRASNWNYTDVFSKEDWNQVWQEIKQTPNFWLYSPEMEGCRQLKDFLYSDDGYYSQVYFITSRAETAGDSAKVQTCQWLESRGLWPRFDRSQVIVVENADQKEQILRDLKIPFYLDDYAPTIQQASGISSLKAYLLNAPYNIHISQWPYLSRVDSVREYLEKVQNEAIIQSSS